MFLLLTHWDRDEINNISQTTFSNVFSSKKIFEFRIKFPWSLFPMVQLTIFQHWFRLWLGAVQVTSHYLNQWWLISPTHICVTRPQCVNHTVYCAKDGISMNSFSMGNGSIVEIVKWLCMYIYIYISWNTGHKIYHVWCLLFQWLATLHWISTFLGPYLLTWYSLNPSMDK